jgi:hypothetical protein
MNFYKKKPAKSKTITLQQLYGIQTDKKTTNERPKTWGDDSPIVQLEEEVRRLQEWKEDF